MKHPLKRKQSKISLYNTQKDLQIPSQQVKALVSFLLTVLKISTDEIIIHFVTESKICRLHKEFFNDPSPTDCITFPIDFPNDQHNAYHILGEVFICPKTALACAKRLCIDPYKELSRYLIHCILHLIGYDDIQPLDRRRMKRKELLCLKQITHAGLLPNAAILKKPLRQKS